jgi:pyruvate/2-oxoglutarate dehydrogenase complex dihydrolipoamide acyltransferase (E2) component
MTEGVLEQWLVADGTSVSSGDPIYTIETDKVTSVVEAAESGVIRESGVEGKSYQVGDVIGSIE